MLKLVQIGREVSPRNLKLRKYKAVITGIIDDKFIVIKKQDFTSELVRVNDIVLNEKVYTLEQIEDKNSEAYKIEEEEQKSNDFMRFKVTLKENLTKKLLLEMNKD